MLSSILGPVVAMQIFPDSSPAIVTAEVADSERAGKTEGWSLSDVGGPEMVSIEEAADWLGWEPSRIIGVPHLGHVIV